MKKKLLKLSIGSILFFTFLFSVNNATAKIQEPDKTTCAATHDGWLDYCDMTTIECCEFHSNGTDYNCNGKYGSERSKQM